MAGKAVSVTTDTFSREVLGSPVPVVVDFWATWCGPCRMVAPVVDELADEYRGRVRFVKVDVDQNEELASRYGVMSIPTLGVFKDGALVSRSAGFIPKPELKRWLEQTLSAGVA